MKRQPFFCLLAALLLMLGCERESTRRPAASTPSRAPAAVHPIVDASEQQLFGASRGDQWMAAEEAAEFVSSGQRYRLYRMTDTLGTRRSAGVEAADETCQNPAVRIPNVPGNGGDVVAVAAAWNALPRVPARTDTTQRVYRQAVADYLAQRGIEAEAARLDQVLRVDLEGDGIDEVLITSNRLRGSATTALRGDYAVVLLRKVVDGTVQQIPLEAEYFPEECIAECAPASYRVVAVLDVNGDGVMEVITGARYFEGRGKRVHAVARDTAEAVLSWQCGT